MDHDKDTREATEFLSKARTNKDYVRTGLIDGKKLEEDGKYFKEKNQIRLNQQKKKSTLIRTIVILIFLAGCAYFLRDGYNKYLRKIEPNPFVDKNSLHYVNNLYQPDGKFFDRSLSEDEKLAYLDWVDKLKKHEVYYQVNYNHFKGLNYQEIEEVLGKIYNVILLEHPELFYFNYYTIETVDLEDVYNIKVINGYTSKFKIFSDIKYKRLERIIDEFVTENKDKNIMAKIKAVYDYFGKKELSEVDNKNLKTLSSAFVGKITSCEALSYGSQVLFQRLGVDSMIAIGMKDFERYFNVIKLEDGYYFFDACVALESKQKKQLDYFYGGYLLENYYDYTTGIYQIPENEMGKSHIYRPLE